MERKLKKMYGEIILDTIINGKWDVTTYNNYGLLYDETGVKFASKQKKVGKFNYKFEFIADGLFFKYVYVYVDDGCFSSKQTETLRYSFLSPIYWRIRQMRIDQLNSDKIAETNLYMDVYKEFKASVAERDIAKIEQSLANLAKAEAEQRKMLEELKGVK